MNPIRIIIAEDHALMRAGIQALLRNYSDIEIVAQAANGREVIQQINDHMPDVVLMDIGMPVLNGFEATAQASDAFPGVAVIIVSMHTKEEYVLRALRAGARGYVVKDAEAEELHTAIRTVALGKSYFSPLVSSYLADYVRRTGGNLEQSPYEALTRRQREVLQLIAEGRTTKEIAAVLHIGVKTVETHRTQLMNHLDIHDIAGLVRYAVRVGIVDVEK
ncbi:MAG: DNA-binding NarL/FixJ family response regulator [Verrucomicrobiales bacterium]|jgi:DNA-binding NarL/FixJ family response regulator